MYVQSTKALKMHLLSARHKLESKEESPLSRERYKKGFPSLPGLFDQRSRPYFPPGRWICVSALLLLSSPQPSFKGAFSLWYKLCVCVLSGLKSLARTVNRIRQISDSPGIPSLPLLAVRIPERQAATKNMSCICFPGKEMRVYLQLRNKWNWLISAPAQFVFRKEALGKERKSFLSSC